MTPKVSSPEHLSEHPLEHPLDNPAWHSLGGVHAPLADSVDGARRYRKGISVFSAIEQPDERGWSGLAALWGPDRVAVLFRTESVGEPPAGWTVLNRGLAYQMTLGEAGPADDTPIVRLTVDDVSQMLALTALTKPGPFLAGTIELGPYWGVFDGSDLIAMAGERHHPPGWTEISAVCTHPSARGRGLAAALTMHVGRTIIERGEQPFLHVAVTNNNAHRVYERLGFTTRVMTEFAGVRTPAAS